MIHTVWIILYDAYYSSEKIQFTKFDQFPNHFGQKKNKIKNNLKNEFSDLKISKIRFYNHMSPNSI